MYVQKEGKFEEKKKINDILVTMTTTTARPVRTVRVLAHSAMASARFVFPIR